MTKKIGEVCSILDQLEMSLNYYSDLYPVEIIMKHITEQRMLLNAFQEEFYRVLKSKAR